MSESAGKTILYIEDDPITLMAYRTRLVQQGFHVVPAMDGLEAMRLLTQLLPDVVILDLMLPKFNGEEILKFIRANPKLAKTPVILLSTNSIIDAKSEPVLETAHRRLIKETCTPAIMLEAVHSALASTN
jgi:CheY-like chemotaxis protein